MTRIPKKQNAKRRGAPATAPGSFMQRVSDFIGSQHGTTAREVHVCVANRQPYSVTRSTIDALKRSGRVESRMCGRCGRHGLLFRVRP